jgi:N-succinyldiaminopimelate aminotransferase
LNPFLDRLHPYPFERVRTLMAGVTPPSASPIRLSIGEPQHDTPSLIPTALSAHFDGLSTYPATAGLDVLREALASWFKARYSLDSLSAAQEVLPVNGTREALFAFAQVVVNSTITPAPLVVCPNPFYQIYEGAALLAGAGTRFLNQTAASNFDLDLESLTKDEWRRTQLLYVCSPGNPTGRVLDLDVWRTLFDYADRYRFVIASDECYSEIYPDEAHPPLGALEAAQRLGRDFTNLVVFTSLSKRSNAPGLRSGGVAGDASLLARFLLYRTYHGSAMSLPVQHASIAAWGDEAHVRDNRTQYREKFDAVLPLLAPVLETSRPDASFYLWARVPGGDDESFTRELFATKHVSVLPGRYLAREAHGSNPGAGYVRIALVPSKADCVEGARRIVELCR